MFGLSSGVDLQFGGAQSTDALRGGNVRAHGMVQLSCDAQTENGCCSGFIMTSILPTHARIAPHRTSTNFIVCVHAQLVEKDQLAACAGAIASVVSFSSFFINLIFLQTAAVIIATFTTHCN